MTFTEPAGPGPVRRGIGPGAGHRRRVPAAVAALVAALAVTLVGVALAGCSGDDEAGSDRSTTTTASDGEDGTVPPGTDATDATTTEVPAPEPVETSGEPSREVEGLTFFLAGGGNLGCGISLESARCDVRERDWEPPPAPSDCDQDWGQGLELGPEGEAVFVCAGDTAFSQEPELADGESIRAGAFTCAAGGDAVTCVAEGSGRGFTLSRQGYDRF